MPPEVGDWEASMASARNELERPIAVGTALPCKATERSDHLCHQGHPGGPLSLSYLDACCLESKIAQSKTWPQFKKMFFKKTNLIPCCPFILGNEEIHILHPFSK